MKWALILVNILGVVLVFDGGRLYGVVQESRYQHERMRFCLDEASVIPDSEVCQFLRAQEFKCHAKPRISQAYWSHKVLSCLMGVRGRYWGRP